MRFLKGALSNNFKNEWNHKELLDKGLIKMDSVNNNHSIIGYNIVSSELINDRIGEYYREIPNLSNWNLYQTRKINSKDNVNGHFTYYVQFFKNYKKHFNYLNPNFKIEISSFHIHSFLYNLFLLNSNLFSSDPDTKSCIDICDKVISASTEYNYNKFYEINGIYLIKRNIDFKNFCEFKRMCEIFKDEKKNN